MLINQCSGFSLPASSLKRHAIAVLSIIVLCGAAIPVHAKTLSDPTRPPGQNERSVGAEESKTNMSVNVTAVFKKNQEFYAVINNSWLKKGEKVGEWRVNEITNAGVFLTNESEPEAMPLRFLVNEKSDFKKQTNNE